MAKQTILAIVAVFVVWVALDFIMHALLLGHLYQTTANLWRPMDQMNIPLMYFVTLVFTSCFVFIYRIFVEHKSLLSGVKFGALFGLATGVSMGFGSYAFMPIPLALACGWFFGSWLEAIIAGAIVGAIIKPEKIKSPQN